MSQETINTESANTLQAGSTIEQEENFAELLEQSLNLPGRFEPGQKVVSKVVTISGDLVYINLGGKTDGAVALNEFKDEAGNVTIHEGDQIEAFFVKAQDGLIMLTTLINGYSTVALNTIRNAYSSGTPVNGNVKSELKGGFEVLVDGVRCFCPYSQIDLRAGQKNNTYVGQIYPFKVLEFKDNGRNVIISRRVLLEEEKQAKIQKLKESLTLGMQVSGRISAIRNFGIFVDLGGMDGLIPASETSWSRIDKLEDSFTIGQELTAKIISVDWDHERLTLSIKAMQPDPWLAATDKFPVGSKVNGTIVRLAPFGAFVSLENGIDGLVHISNLGAGRRINHPKEVVQLGQEVEAYVLSVDPSSKKISLSLQPKQEAKKLVLPEIGDVIEGTVENIMPYGIFLKINDTLTGLIPNGEMGTSRGTEHATMFKVGTTMKVAVIDVDSTNGKVRLSRKKIFENAEQEEFSQYIDSVKKEEKSSNDMGILGELLKAKMAEKKITF